MKALSLGNRGAPASGALTGLIQKKRPVKLCNQNPQVAKSVERKTIEQFRSNKPTVSELTELVSTQPPDRCPLFIRSIDENALAN